MKKLLILISALLVVLFVMLAVLPQVFINYKKKKIENDFQEACSSCELKIGEISYSLFRASEIEISNFFLISEKAHALESRLQIESIKIHFDPMALFSKMIQVSQISVRGMQVELIDTDKAPKNSQIEGSENDFHFYISHVKVLSARFKYTRKHHGTVASIHINNIRGEIGEFTDLKKPNTQLASAHFNLQIENRGRVQLDVDTRDFLKIKNVMASLTVTNQDLSDLNIFLKPNAGVMLKGNLQKGIGFVNMNGKHETAKVNASYENLEVKVEPFVQRSELESYFTNIGASLAMKPENLTSSPQSQSRDVDTDRQEGESIVGFMLRGLKEAAIKVAMAPKK